MRPGVVLATGTVAAAMAGLDGTVLNVAIPTIASDLDADLAEVEWVVSAYSLAFAALLILFGTLGDAFGHRRMLIGGLVLFVTSSAFAALAPNAQLLITARALAGIGAAAMSPAYVALIVAAYAPERRANAIGVMFGGASVGLALGPLIGGLLVETVGWPWVFWLSVPLGLGALALTLTSIPETEPHRPDRLDFPGVALSIGALLGFTYGLIESTVSGFTSPEVLIALVAGLVLGAAFIVRERRAATPEIDLRLFGETGFRSPLVIAAVVAFGMLSVFLFVSIYYQQLRGLSAIETGLLYLPSTLAIVVLAPLSGRAADRFGARAAVSVALLFAAAGLGLFAFVDPDTSLLLLGLAQLLIGIGAGLALPSLSALTIAAVESARSGLASSVMRTSREMAGTFGVAVIGALVVAFAGLSFRGDLERSDLPAPAVAALDDAKVVGGAPLPRSGLSEPQYDSAREFARDAAATGIGRALACGAVLVLLAALYSVRTLPRRRPAEAAAREAH